jgi:hypothetical protein
MGCEITTKSGSPGRRRQSGSGPATMVSFGCFGNDSGTMIKNQTNAFSAFRAGDFEIKAVYRRFRASVEDEYLVIWLIDKDLNSI